MTKITKKELKVILEKHVKWLNGDPTGVQADFSGKDLQGLDFSYYRTFAETNLAHANFCNANLSGTRLHGVNLEWADFTGANLHGAIFEYARLLFATMENADLSDADFNNATLDYATLTGSNCKKTNFSDANLVNTDFEGANLSGANFRCAVCYNAEFYDANLRNIKCDSAVLNGARLDTAENVPFIPQCAICPSEGDFVGWKKLKDGLIAKILIPAKAKRSNATGRTCRCEYANVLAIYDGTKQVRHGETNCIGVITDYTVGRTTVLPDPFDTNNWNESSHGIHFFITRTEAENYDTLERDEDDAVLF